MSSRPLPFLRNEAGDNPGARPDARSAPPAALRSDPATPYAGGNARGNAGENNGPPEIHPPLLEHVITAVRKAERRMEQQRRRIAQLEALSITDELTGLLNRRGFLAGLRRTLAIARRYGEPGTLILCDLDDFKEINDRCGHMAGDKALRHVSALFSRSIRETDLLGRLGGDEFAILLPRTPLEDGRIRASLLNDLITRSWFWWDGQRLPLQASFGLAPYKPGDEEEDLMRRVDEAMYACKREHQTSDPESPGPQQRDPGPPRLVRKGDAKPAYGAPAGDPVVFFPPLAS